MEKNCENCKYNISAEDYDMKRCKKCSRTERAFFEQFTEDLSKKNEETAASLMEQFIEEGTYPTLKKLQQQLEDLKKEVRYRLKDSEVRRHEYQKYNVVAKFVPKSKSSTDNQGLIENLFCYLQDRIVCNVLRLDIPLIKKEIPEELIALEPFKKPPTYYVKPSFNKVGKELISQSEQSYTLSELSLNQLVKRFIPLQEQCKNLEATYESFKKKMSMCAALTDKGKLTHKYGSVSLVANRPVYDMEKVLDAFGDEFLVKYATPDNAQLQSLIDNKILPKSEVERFQTVVDYRLDFIMMPLDVERRITSQFQQMAIQKSLSLFA
ncbi:hypothetical protein ACFVAD_20545 [Sutcliffiella sp. NPDC057660]|uniref:hypothetical protein n=1 Tax=Sutcliffiella sp. NPDC057660 TaxID=3346199 RepID=UPI0036C0F412